MFGKQRKDTENNSDVLLTGVGEFPPCLTLDVQILVIHAFLDHTFFSFLGGASCGLFTSAHPHGAESPWGELC